MKRSACLGEPLGWHMGGLADVMNLFDSFFSQVLTLVPFVSLKLHADPLVSLYGRFFLLTVCQRAVATLA